MTGAAMKVCYFGTYSVADGYPRNRILIKGLKLSGVIVKECRVNLWHGSSDKVGKLFKTTGVLLNFFRILWAQVLLILKFMRVGRYDIMIVGSTGHLEIFLAKILNFISRKPVIFDAFISLYDTIVNDRKIFRKNSALASLLRWIDRTACRLADIVLLDTNAHIEYFCKEFKLPQSKFRRVFVGADDDIFFPIESQRDKIFTVLFFGSFIPLHGIEYIIGSAKILESEKEIRFVIIGTGQESKKIYKIADTLNLVNIEFINRFIPETELAQYIIKADICLGIFGQTRKADIVIPCKIFNCIAMKKPVITGKTTAIKELLDDGKDAILCEPGNAEQISNAILALKKNPDLAKSIADSGCNKYLKTSSINVISRIMNSILEEIRMKNSRRESA